MNTVLIARTFQFESKVICQMPALMIAAQEEEGVGIPDLEGPQV